MATEPKTSDPSADGSAPADLMQGWDWADLLGMPIREHLPKGEVDEHLARLAKELEPLTESLNEQLATRGDNYTPEERIEALERKVYTLRQANQLLIWLAIHRVEKLYESLRKGLLDEAVRLRSGSAASRRSVDEDAQRLARRRRMLGQ